MTKLIATVALAALLLPSVAAAQNADRDRGNGGAETSRDDRESERESYDLADYVLGRGDFAPNGRDAAAGDVLPEDLINEICEDGDVIIIYGDDGSIDDWDCDFG